MLSGGGQISGTQLGARSRLVPLGACTLGACYYRSYGTSDMEGC